MMAFLRNSLSTITSLLLALAGAVVIWTVAVQQADPIDDQLWQIPVQVIGQPADGRVLSLSSPTVQVSVEGPTSALSELSTEDFVAFVDLSQVGYGDVEVPVNVQVNRERIDLTSWVPETARVELEQIVSKEVPVTVDVRGSVASGHRSLEPVVEPGTLVVTGPASRIGNLAEGRVSVFLDNARQTTVFSGRPFFYDTQGAVVGTTGLSLSVDVVQITVPVEQLEGFAQKPVTVQWSGVPAPGYRLLNVTVEPDSILVAGRPTDLADLSRLQTESIDITGLKDSFTQQVTLDLPDGIEVDQPQPIFVTVEIEPILTSDVVDEIPELRALGEGLTATLDVETVRIFLFGPLETIDSLAEEDVRVTLDLLGLEPGTYAIEPIVSVSANDIEVRSFQPDEVTVLITNVVTVTDGLTETVPVTETSLLFSVNASNVGPLGQASPSSPAASAPVALVPDGLALPLRRPNRA